MFMETCDIDGLNEVSIKYNLPLVFDAAQLLENLKSNDWSFGNVKYLVSCNKIF